MSTLYSVIITSTFIAHAATEQIFRILYNLKFTSYSDLDVISNGLYDYMTIMTIWTI